MSRKIPLSILFIIVVSLTLHLVKLGEVPPCLNADEAAFGYNAYSLLKTGRDEFGKFLPLRLTSFGDYKLPLYSYLSVPFIALFGLNQESIRILNLLLTPLTVLVFFAVSRQLFKKNHIALLSAFLLSVSLWFFIIARQAHEALLSSFFMLLAIYCLLRLEQRQEKIFLFFSGICAFVATFAYHPARLLFVPLIFYLLIKNFARRSFNRINIVAIAVLLILLLTPFIIDVKYGINRVESLWFYKQQGFQQRIDELLIEHPNRILHNKGAEAIFHVTQHYFMQFSPEFFFAGANSNLRFGFEKMALMTPVDYVFIIMGLFFLFKRKQKYRYLILTILLLSPFSNALTFQDYGFNRVYSMIFPLVWIISYGVVSLFNIVKNYRREFFYAATMSVTALFFFFLWSSWDIYLNHYPKKAVVARNFQCGYSQLNQYIKKNYDRFDKFVITTRHGQPYIFTLFYLGFDPAVFQHQAILTKPDENGFSTVDRFDKFNFEFKFDKKAKKTVFVGYPDEFIGRNIDINDLKKIKFGTDEIFWIYET